MALTVAELVVEIGANIGGATRGIEAVENRLNNAARGASAMASTLAPVAVALGAVGAVGLRTFSGYEDAMAELVARTGLAGDELARVEALTMEVGKTGLFSATQAANAMLQLVSSGQSADEALRTLPEVLKMAAVSGLDLGTSADALTDILAMFNLQVADSAALVDILAAAEGASSATVATLTQGMANVGTVARDYGVSVEMTAAALAVLSENGIKGVEAGTALKSMLLDMTRPTDEVQAAWNALGTSFYDATGAARPLPDVLADIQKGLAGKAPEEANEILNELVGRYGILAMNALTGELSIEAMMESMAGQASAAEVAAAKTNTLSGRMRQMRSTVEALLIRAMRPFVERYMKPAVEVVTALAGRMADWAAAHPDLMSKITLVGAGIVGFVTVLAIAGKALAVVAALLGALSLSVGLVIAAVAALALAWKTNFLGIGDAINGAISWMSDLAGKVKAAWDEGGWQGAGQKLLAELLLGIGDLVEWARINITDPLINTLETTNWGAVDNRLDALLEKFLGWAGTAWADATAWVEEQVVGPLGSYLSNVNWPNVSNQLSALLEKFLGWAGTAWADAGAWMQEKIIDPIIDYLKTVDWPSTINQLESLMESLLSVAGRAANSVSDLVHKYIIRPIADYLGGITAADWIGANVEIGQAITTILDAMIAGAVDFLTWVTGNILTPIGNELIKPELWLAALTAVGAALLAAITITATLAVWAIGKLGEIAQALIDAVPGVASSLLQVGTDVLAGIAAGLADVGTWAYDKIVQPIIDMFASAVTIGAVGEAAKKIGEAIYNAVLEAVKGLPLAIAKIIDDAIPNKLDLGITSIDLPDTPVADALGAVGFAKGGIALRPMLATVAEREPEAIIPLSRLGEMGAGRSVVISGPVYIQGVQHPAQLWRELEREAGRRNVRLGTALGRA